MPTSTKRLLIIFMPPELADIIVSMADDDLRAAWDPYGFWAATTEPEYDSEGNYGSLPMAPVQVVSFY